MPRLKVAYLIDSLGAGGSERSLAEMLPHLMGAGVEPRLFVLSRPERGFAGLVREHGLEVEQLPAANWLARRAYLRRQLATWEAHLLHTTLFHSDVLGRLAAWRLGVPVVSSLVGVGYEPERLADPGIRAWRLAAVRMLDGFTGRHLTAHFHAVSQAAKDSAIARLGLDPGAITVVRRGRDVERYRLPDAEGRRASRERWRVGPDELLVVNLGRQTFHKGQHLLLQAVHRLLESGRPMRLVVAGGEGPATADLRRYVDRHDLAARVELAGHVEDVPGLLAAADIFAFPSRLEGFPGAVLEAVAMGLPVVVADIPALREIFPQPAGALLFERDSEEQLAAALCELADDPARRLELGRRGRELFVERFDIRQTVPAMLDLYHRVAGAGAGR